MLILRETFDSVSAAAIAAYLRGRGVIAGVIHEVSAVQWQLGLKGARIAILHKDEEPRTLGLIEEYRSHPPSAEEHGDGDDNPDLALLDPLVRIACPSCNASLQACKNPATCPTCGSEIDAIGLLIDQHGPEVLDPCYENSNGVEFADEAGLNCPSCGYWLEGLPRRGICPECAMSYDKDAIVAAFLNNLAHGTFGRRDGEG